MLLKKPSSFPARPHHGAQLSVLLKAAIQLNHRQLIFTAPLRIRQQLQSNTHPTPNVRCHLAILTLQSITAWTTNGLNARRARPASAGFVLYILFVKQGHATPSTGSSIASMASGLLARQIRYVTPEDARCRLQQNAAHLPATLQIKANTAQMANGQHAHPDLFAMAAFV